MDIEKAIDILHDIMVEGFTVGDRIFDMEPDESEAIQTSMSGLQELQQYRQIGTVDECREAMEKQSPKEPIMKPYDDLEDEYLCCPNCGEMLTDRMPFDPKTFYFHCLNCGQKFKWGD